MKTPLIYLCILTFFIMFSSAYSQIITDFKVNYFGLSTWDIGLSISTDSSGNFIITWANTRDGNANIYAQCYSSEGATLGDNFKVDDVEGQGRFPSISSDGNGNYVITWGDERCCGGDIYAQSYSSEGEALGNNFKVTDDTSDTRQYDACVIKDSNGNFVITWYDLRNGGYDIYAQRYSSDGLALSDNFKVNDAEPSAYHDGPSISSDKSGNFVITWSDLRNGDFDIYAQRYSSDGNALSGNFKVKNDNEVASHFNPDISSDDEGNFVITWESSDDIYAQCYSSNGTTLSDNFKVNDGDTSTWHYNPSVSLDGNGNFVIIWVENSNSGANIYAQRYLSDGTALGSNFRVTNTDEGWQDRPDVKLWNNRIYCTWKNESDIWANVLDWNNPTKIDEKDLQKTPSVYQLSQNYPNPFNPSTTIEFTLPKSEFTTLKVYNILGKEVAILVSNKLNPGSHTYQFDSKNLASGIYYYQLVAGDYREVKKMILLR